MYKSAVLQIVIVRCLGKGEKYVIVQETARKMVSSEMLNKLPEMKEGFWKYRDFEPEEKGNVLGDMSV